MEVGLARDTHFDVIIVGGRPAGSTLAARLGAQGLRVLVVERATFPSPPAASSPVIYGSTMRLLDEVGVDERDDARSTPALRRWIMEIRDDFRVVNPVPDVFGRDYGYAIDRARFDDALWHNTLRFPSVTALQRFTVTALEHSEGRVAGIRGRYAGGPETTYTADSVVGADGRFSLVAREVNAATIEAHTEHPTTLYYAYWKNVAPYDDNGPAIHAYGPGYGYGFLLMDSADDTVAVVVEGQSMIINPGPEKPRPSILSFCSSIPGPGVVFIWPSALPKCMECARSATCIARPAGQVGRLSATLCIRKIRSTARGSTTQFSLLEP